MKKNFQKKFTGTLKQGRSGSGWDDHKHLQVMLNNEIIYSNFILDIS